MFYVEFYVEINLFLSLTSILFGKEIHEWTNIKFIRQFEVDNSVY